MTDAKDAALDKAIEAFHKAWPGFRKWFASTDLAEIPPEPFEAAIAAYLAALPKDENVAREVIALLRAAAAMLSVPEGFVMVPVEPTFEMLDAALPVEAKRALSVQRGKLIGQYKAMLAARPDQFAENANCPPAQEEAR